MKTYFCLLSLILLIGSIATGCGGDPGDADLAASIETQIAVAVAETAAAAPGISEVPTTIAASGDTPALTGSPPPTSTQEPTNTPSPTGTPRPTSTPRPTLTPLPLGVAADYADWEYLVTDAVIMPTIGDLVARGAFVVASVQVTNHAPAARELGGQFFVAQDAQGRLYEMHRDASLKYYQTFGMEAWFLDDIGPSMTRTIPIAFDVSPDASGVVLMATRTAEPSIALVDEAGGQALTLRDEPLTSVGWAFITGDVNTAASIGGKVARGVFVVVVVSIQNITPTTQDLGSSFFLLKDGEGRTYTMDSEASLEYHQTFDTDAWHLESLGPSLIGTVPVVFDVSPDATAMTLATTAGSPEPVFVLDAVGGEPIELSGDVQSSGTWEFVISDAETATTIGNQVALGQFIIVILDVKNNAPTQQSVGARTFALKDAQGRTYAMSTDASLGYHQTFRTDAWYLDDIGPSLVGTVPVVFDVAADASGFVLATQAGAEIPLP